MVGRRASKWAGLLLCVFCSGLAACGCKKLFRKPPAEGQPCLADQTALGDAVCLDASTALVCDVDMTWKRQSCKGKRGCSGEGIARFAARCDVSGNGPGDPCTRVQWNQRTCGADGKSLVVCGPVSAPLPVEGEVQGYELLRCGGPSGCSGAGVSCPAVPATHCQRLVFFQCGSRRSLSREMVVQIWMVGMQRSRQPASKTAVRATRASADRCG